MRILVVGRDNPFNRGVIDWLSDRFAIVVADARACGVQPQRRDVQLELNGGFVPLDISLRKKGYYSWMRLTSFFRACVARAVGRIEEVR